MPAKKAQKKTVKKSDNGYVKKARSEAKNRWTSPGTGKTWFGDSEWDVSYIIDDSGYGQTSRMSHQKFSQLKTLKSQMAERRPKRAR